MVEHLGRQPVLVTQIEDKIINQLIARGGDVSSILEQLSISERTVLLMLVVDELTASEVGNILKISPSTVRTLYHRARAKLETHRRSQGKRGRSHE